jgi:hypothetical protein
MRGERTFQIQVSDTTSISSGKSKKDVKGKKKTATVKSVNRTQVEEISQFDDDDDLGQPIDHYSRTRVEDPEDEPLSSKYILPPHPRRANNHSSEVIEIEDEGINTAPSSSSEFHKSLLKLRRSVRTHS